MLTSDKVEKGHWELPQNSLCSAAVPPPQMSYLLKVAVTRSRHGVFLTHGCISLGSGQEAEGHAGLSVSP